MKIIDVITSRLLLVLSEISGKFPEISKNIKFLGKFTTLKICNSNSNVTWSMCVVLVFIKIYSVCLQYTTKLALQALYMLRTAYASVCPSVRLSVTLRNEGTQKDAVFTTG